VGGRVVLDGSGSPLLATSTTTTRTATITTAAPIANAMIKPVLDPLGGGGP
jgi:hypothetical protein